MRRSSAFTRAALALLAIAAAWNLVSVTFVGSTTPAPKSGSPATQVNGYRLDWMLEKKDGTSDLQTQDGYFVGERGFEKSQGAQGLRYRMRPTAQEYKEGKEVDGLMFKLGPIKLKLGEMFGGCATNEGLRKLKRRVVAEGVSDPKKIEENKYWEARYGHKRWVAPYVDQAQGTAKTFLRGLAAWSGYDPKKEERGITWFEADYGKPWLAKYVGTKVKGWVSAAQVEKEFDRGKLNGKYLSLPKAANDNRVGSGFKDGKEQAR